MQYEHCQTHTVARACVLQHLSVTGRVAERSIWAAPDDEVDGFGFAGVVVVEEQLRLLGKHRFPVIGVAVLYATHGANDLLGRNTVHLLCIRAHEVLATTRYKVGLVTI